MEAQLHLLPTEDDVEASWRLDDSTRAIGRRGVADARGALRAALRHRADEAAGDADPVDGQGGRAAASRHASAA
jgi:hypothetical protein